MTRTALTVLGLLLLSGPGSAQDDQAIKPLPQWNVAALSAESKAACGAWLTQLGMDRNMKEKPDRVFQLLYRGAVLDSFSRQADPAIHAQAWAASPQIHGVARDRMFRTCFALAETAMTRKLIPQAILDDALFQAHIRMQ